MASNQPRPLMPVLALLLGASMWGVVWYPLRLLEQAGLSGLWQALFIYLAAFVTSLPLTLRHWRDLSSSPGIMLGLAVSAGWTNVAFILAILDGNVLRVLLLFYLSPIWAVILSRLFLGELISRARAITLIVAMAGAAIMLWDTSMGMPWPQESADWLALTSGMAFATSNVLVRKGQHISLQAKVAATWIGVIVVAGLLIVLWHEPAPLLSSGIVLGAYAVGVLGMLVMTALVQYGVTHMPLQRSAVILLFELVAGAISQQLLTQEIMLAHEWLGGALIMLAAYYSARQ